MYSMVAFLLFGVKSFIGVCCMGGAGLELLSFLLLPPRRWDYGPIPPCLVYVVLGKERKALEAITPPSH